MNTCVQPEGNWEEENAWEENEDQDEEVEAE